MIDQIDGHRADRSQSPVIVWRIQMALDLDQLAVRYMQQGAAVAMTTAAHTFENIDINVRPGGWSVYTTLAVMSELP